MSPFTNEHQMLRRTIRAFVEKEVVPQVTAWEEAGQIPRAFWQRLGELGLLGLEFPVEYGGGGSDFFSSVVLGEEMARCRSGGVAFSVLVHTDMSSPWLTRYGTEAQKRKYLPGMTRGETVCALGITEPGAGSDMAAVSTRAVRRGDHYLLTGSKIFITNGVYGDLYFVAARTGHGSPERRHDGISMFLVERGLPGFAVSRKLDKMGMLASDTAELAFQECPVPAENLLGVEGRGFQQLAAGLQRERIMAAVLALSGAAHALEDTTATFASVTPSASRWRRSRRCVIGWPTWPPRSRPGASSCTTPPRSTPPAWTAGARSPWRSSSPPRWPTVSRTRPCRCTAATGTCASSRWSASSATCGSGPSRRARRR